MPITRWKCLTNESAVDNQILEHYNTKSELWNDIRILLTHKYDVPHGILIDYESELDKAEELLQRILDDEETK